MTDSRYLLDREEEQGRTRLALLERMQDPGTLSALEAIGVGPGWHCLEVGAGAGSIARWLAARVGEHGRVVAIDADTRYLRGLRLPNVEVRQQDVSGGGFEEAAYDLVHARNLLVHVPERAAVLRGLADAVRPGGWILLEEPDVVTDGPDPTAPPDRRGLYESVTAGIFRFLRDRGLDPNLGARLPGLLRALGFESVRGEGRVAVFQGSEGGTPSPHGMAFAQLREPLGASGHVPVEAFDEFLRLFRDPSFSWREALTMSVYGRKGTGGEGRPRARGE